MRAEREENVLWTFLARSRTEGEDGRSQTAGVEISVERREENVERRA
jgi:hypothetical protein